MGDKDNPLADDLLVGAAAIADYLYGDPAKRRKVYGLAESKALPLFHMGREICARKSTLQKWVAAREAGAGNERPAS
jgi:predicted kinase